MIEIVPFELKYTKNFKSLNIAWIEQVFEKVGDADLEILDNPENQIIESGGAIMIALKDGEAVGTCALINKGNKVFELAKMAVAPEARGNGLGGKLGEAVLKKAKELNAQKVFLETHSLLVPAIGLYKKLGFKETCVGNSNSLCNLQMELEL